MRTYIGFLVLFSASIIFSGCAEHYYGRRGYSGVYGYSNRDYHHDRRHDNGRYDHRYDRDDRR
jgi:hypothetical protein